MFCVFCRLVFWFIGTIQLVKIETFVLIDEMILFCEGLFNLRRCPDMYLKKWTLTPS